jgi:trypsin
VTGRGLGALPTLGALSRLPKHASMTAVGYGLQKSFPDAASQNDRALRIRMVAHPRIMGIDDKSVGDFAIYISHDASRGGICFGDSGGPNFIGDSNVVGAVSSFAQNDTCKGHNGAYRIDQLDDLTWLAAFGLRPS